MHYTCAYKEELANSLIYPSKLIKDKGYLKSICKAQYMYDTYIFTIKT